MSLIELLARRTKALRAAQGLTQEELAGAAKFSFKFYQQIEGGRKKQIWLETVERLAAAYGLEAWELIGAEEPKARRAPEVTTSNIHYRPKKPKNIAKKKR